MATIYQRLNPSRPDKGDSMARKKKSNTPKTENRAPSTTLSIGKKKFRSEMTRRTPGEKALTFMPFSKFVKANPTFMEGMVLELAGEDLSGHTNREALTSSLLELLSYKPSGKKGEYFVASAKLRETVAASLVVDNSDAGAPIVDVCFRRTKCMHIPFRRQASAALFLEGVGTHLQLEAAEKDPDEMIDSPLFLGTILDTGLVTIKVRGETRGMCSLWQAVTGLPKGLYKKLMAYTPLEVKEMDTQAKVKARLKKAKAEAEAKAKAEAEAKAARLDALLAPMREAKAKAKAEAEAKAEADWMSNKGRFVEDWENLRVAYANQVIHMVEWDHNLLRFLRPEGPAEGSELKVYEMVGEELYVTLCHFLVEVGLGDKTSPQVRGLLNRWLEDNAVFHMAETPEEPLFSGYGYFNKGKDVKFLAELPPLEDFNTRKGLLNFLNDSQFQEMVDKERIYNFRQLLLSSDEDAS